MDSGTAVMLPHEPKTEYYSPGLRARYCLDGIPNPIPAEHATYADIGYITDKSKYLARMNARLDAGGLEKELPPGWPKSVEGRMVWSADSFKSEDDVVVHLSHEDIRELEYALKRFNELELDGYEVEPDNFPLPTLAKKLHSVRDEVYDGKGFTILRGLDPDAYSTGDLTIIYLGISSYIAPITGKQDQKGSHIMHVIDRNYPQAVKHTDDEKPFHTDTICDTLALLCRSCSASGGRSILASSAAVYNELAATRPDLIHVLAKEDWPFDTYGRDPPYYRRALLYWHEGHVILNFSRRLLTGKPPFSPRSRGIPGLNEAQAEALDAVTFTAVKYEFRTSVQKGDIRFINNLALLHRPEAFEDSDTAHRHLIRLWLHNPDKVWKLPEALGLAMARVFGDDEREDRWDIEPVRLTNGILLRTAPSCD
ncbi:hypothetical protein LTS15_008819 [Exophiala xenobiotica]|nr:hypothetical protein LTS15_008819 [Exophiala xenobiotica]